MLNKDFEIMLETDVIENRISELAKQISEDYRDKNLHLICVLKGGVFFMTRLAQNIDIDLTMDFMSVSSYGNDTKSSGVVKIIKDLDENIADKDVLIVEDIIDSGNTLSYLVKLLEDRAPKSVKICTLLDKPARREVDLKSDYVGFEIEDKFVLGYGLDDGQYGRNLPFIAAKKI